MEARRFFSLCHVMWGFFDCTLPIRDFYLDSKVFILAITFLLNDTFIYLYSGRKICRYCRKYSLVSLKEMKSGFWWWLVNGAGISLFVWTCVVQFRRALDRKSDIGCVNFYEVLKYWTKKSQKQTQNVIYGLLEDFQTHFSCVHWTLTVLHCSKIWKVFKRNSSPRLAKLLSMKPLETTYPFNTWHSSLKGQISHPCFPLKNQKTKDFIPVPFTTYTKQL